MLGGQLYFIDKNDHAARYQGESTTPGTVFVRGLDLIDGGYPYLVAIATDPRGYWELRAVPDGTYQVYWPPSITPDQFDETIPPVQSVVLNPIETIQAIAVTVRVENASRILNIDFGIPRPIPVAGAAVPAAQLPNTGRGGGGGNAPFLLLAGSVIVSLLLAGGISWSRRRVP